MIQVCTGLGFFSFRHSARPPPNPQTSRLFEGAARVLAFASHGGVHFQTLDRPLWLQLVPPPPHLGGMGWEQKKRAVGGGQLEPKWHTTSWPSTSKLLQVSCRKFLCHFLLRHSARPPPNPQTSRLFEGAARVLAFASHGGIHFQTLDRPLWLQLVPPPPLCSACKLRHFTHVISTELDSNMKFPP